MSSWNIVITCEHAGNSVPEKYQSLFSKYVPLLESHRGYDKGAAFIACSLKKALDVPCFMHNVTRLLVETNRSLHHPMLFSEITRKINEQEKKFLLERYYFPYRNKVFHHMQEMLHFKKKVLHLSIHSFTPVLNEKIRETELGLLYDPRRKQEKEYCLELKSQLARKFPGRVRCNYPYLGTSDGFTTWLRRQFDADKYVGIEIEINQKLFDYPRNYWKYGIAFPLIRSLI